MSRDSGAVEALIEEFPYQIHQIRGPWNELVWVEKGVNPDDVFADKRKTDWPYSQMTADLICQQIAEGTSLGQICRQVGYPTYNVLCRWRRENSDFNLAIEQAYKDRGEFFREKILELVGDLESGADIGAVTLKLEALKWLAEPCGSKIDKKATTSFHIQVGNKVLK